MPGLILAAASSNSGKTTLSLGLQRLLQRKGVRVTPAKCGPDYIDPAFHAVASGQTSLNLDPWAMRAEDICLRSQAHAAHRDLLFVEGVMGLFDGAAGGRGSTANLARTLKLPVFLVLDVKGQAQTAAAIAAGIRDHDKTLSIAGVILNRVGSEIHEALLREAFGAISMPVVGAIRQSSALELPSRHLGLVQAGEYEALSDRIDAIADHMDKDIDLALMLDIARQQSNLPSVATSDASPLRLPPLGQHIAIAKDAAFTFIYPHILQDWKEQGASLSFFSPLADEEPDKGADAIYLPGGYPELHLDALSTADRFKRSMKQAAAENRTIFAECGGYMVLGHSIIGVGGEEKETLGFIPLTTSFSSPKLKLGYRILSPAAGDLFSSAMTAHEFHYATIEWQGACDPLFHATTATGAPLQPMGQRVGSVCGSFAHIIGLKPS
ncbi:cobyrinate a,c-diamide synthase [Cohaesibacter sp. ES.047]|uniref:cobyrinate a,c-diamide synthase n=1 Tax=Cohaesibacter sp. ES.047 TaxID=1798205 RepID=UPI000BB99088|nr:cobyrinate a,c-diamide synthase [Cohaesibacter sp. ES.047]